MDLQPVRVSRRPFSMMRAFLDNSASGGIVLLFAAMLAMVMANSPLASVYFSALSSYVGPLSVGHWINDGLMAMFFLLVGLELKREVLDGQLSTWPRRILPGIAAAGGMAIPALIFVGFNAGDPVAVRGWAIPGATDIAFALGVLSLLGDRVPAALKVFLTALAIIDDVGAVAIIAVFYTSGISLPALVGALLVLAALVALNRFGVMRLAPYLILGAVLWLFVLQSGVHATLAGITLALTIPLRRAPGLRHDLEVSPLHRMEHSLHRVVPFVILPIFGFANAGVSLSGLTADSLTQPLTLGIAVGLVAGKVVGVFGAAWLAVKAGLADAPANATPSHLLGVALLCGIGFTMSLFIALLAFPENPGLQDGAKLGILLGSTVAGTLGAAVLLLSPRPGSEASRLF